MSKIVVQDASISIVKIDEKDYISLTDMVRNIENGLALIEKWLRNKNTIEFLGIWEEMYNPNFNSPEFEGIKSQAGLNRFVLSVKQWSERTNSLGLKQWRDDNPEQKGNIRDYASINELICLSNMENLNAVFIEQGMTQSERLLKLNQIAIHQMSVLEGDSDRKLLK